MRFVSTRGAAPPADLRTALLSALAPDGGLYLPARIEPLAAAELRELRGADLPEVAAAALAQFFAEIPPADLGRIAATALDFPIPLVPVAEEPAPAADAIGLTTGPEAEPSPPPTQPLPATSPTPAAAAALSQAPGEPLYVLELFDGPTLAFKDVGARFLARLLAWVRRGEDRPLTVLVATSGDTGGAVASAFARVPGTRVVALYPQGRISPLQERQMTTLGGNVRALAVAGSFDDCQRLVKTAFADRRLAGRFALTSANSINLGRLLPQAVYYLWAALRLPPGAPPPLFAVPSGNFGNLTAGLLARRLAPPLLEDARFVAATNANDAVPRFLAGEPYRERPSEQTLSTAMDVGAPSNFERLVALCGGSEEGEEPRVVPAAIGDSEPSFGEPERRALAARIAARSFDDEATRATIARVWRDTGTLLDPHTAVGWLALEAQLAADRAGGAPPASGIVLATAHPAKFPEVVEPIVGRPVPLPPALAAALDRPARTETLPADPAALADVLLSTE